MINKILEKIQNTIDPQKLLDDLIIKSLIDCPHGLKILDAGCGEQRFRSYCSHLEYYSQDFGKFEYSNRKTIRFSKENKWNYGNLDYTCDITDIPESDCYFDIILCTEVLEHVPYPNIAIRELVRLLKPKGILILSSPINSLRHQDPFFFTAGLSDNWYYKILSDENMNIRTINQIGDYYKYMALEIARTIVTHSFFLSFMLLPSFFYYFLRRPNSLSISSTGFNIFCVAIKNQ